MSYVFNPFTGNFDSTGSSNIIAYQEFTSNGTWTKPVGISFVYVECIGGGGGGGSGRKNSTTATARPGGAGGASAKFVSRWFSASEVGETVTITVGTGGTGGAGRTVTGDGNPGGDGGSSSFGTLLITPGGSGGGGGNVTSITAGAVSQYGFSANGLYGASGGTASITGGTATSASRASLGP